MTTSQIEPAGTKTVTYFRKPERSFWQIWNMSFGFLGIQFGWGLQMANMSAIYEYLGARADQIPILWLAAPLTGLLIQPLIGHASDHTWGRLGRRRPYFLAGAILSSLDASLHAKCIGIVDGRRHAVDSGRFDQREHGAIPRIRCRHPAGGPAYLAASPCRACSSGSAQSFSSALPYILTNVFHMQQKVGDTRAVPTVVRISFYVGAVAFIGAVLWTIVTTKEYPPQDMEAFRRAKAEKTSLAASAREIFAAIAEMPDTMRKLGPVQLLHVAGSLLHVALLPRRGGAQRVWSQRHEFTALSGGSGVGRQLLCDLLHRLFRVFICAAEPGSQTGPQKHAHRLPDMWSAEPDVGRADS